MAHADYNIGHGLAIKLNGSPVAIDPKLVADWSDKPPWKQP